MPEIVRACYDSVKRHSSGHPVILLTMDNIKDHVEIPDSIYRKLLKGEISSAFFSDILRNTIIYQKGGIWMDATIYLTSDIDLSRYHVFSIHREKTGTTNVSQSRWTSFFMAGVKGNYFNKFISEYLISYVDRFDCLIDYHLIDYTIDCGYRNFGWFRSIVDSFPLSNPDIYYFQQNIDKSIEPEKLAKITCRTGINKLDRRVVCPTDNNALYYKLVNGRI